MRAAKTGMQLDVCDAMIDLMTSRPKARYSADVFVFGHETLRRTVGGWVWRRLAFNGVEQELGRYGSLPDAVVALKARSADLSSRNRWARKTLIR